jgi:hypothetical protein
MAASGLVSVMPHPCTILTPYLCKNCSAKLRGTAAPPHGTTRIDEKSTGIDSA